MIDWSCSFSIEIAFSARVELNRADGVSHDDETEILHGFDCLDFRTACNDSICLKVVVGELHDGRADWETVQLGRGGSGSVDFSVALFV